MEATADLFCNECDAQYTITYDLKLVPERATICCPWCSAADISDHHKEPETVYPEENED
jgi:hypothetical protein